MTSVNDLSMPDHIPSLLDRAHRRMQRDLAALVDSSRFPELRGSHLKILSMIPAEGARPSALAAVANMTRPALGELVRHLQVSGYVAMSADPSDRRAVIVQLTKRGRRASAVVADAIDELRVVWSTQIGPERVDALIDALTALAVEPDA